ncbi:MAG: efflux transporter outer membrane subunit [Verrucomicrobia bacterium]|nr:MAG: efflux transporter outer membrane subunit [Verrucomicrobiota bacterium]
MRLIGIAGQVSPCRSAPWTWTMSGSESPPPCRRMAEGEERMDKRRVRAIDCATVRAGDMLLSCGSVDRCLFASHRIMSLSRSLVLVAAALASCTLGPDFVEPGADAGRGWKQSLAKERQALPDSWWTLFGDSELDRLVERAIATNHELAAAKARLDTARALVGVDRARLFPRLDLGAAASESRASAAVAGANLDLESQRYRSGFDLSYDLDLWGRNRRALEAARSEAQAAEALLDAQRLGIAAEVARQYFLLRGLDVQELVLADTVASRRESLDLELTRTEAGMSDGLASSRARTELELARNDLAMVQRQRGSAEHALAVLCGNRPSDFAVKVRDRVGGAALPVIRPGLPSEVMARRPDLRASLEKLRAANARIGVSEAEFYPRISLSGAAGFEALGASHFLDWENRVLSLGTDLASPLFDGGERRAASKAIRARFDEAMADHRQILLLALREVEDSLVDLKGLARSRSALDAALVSARETRRLARERYDKGVSSYLEVVDADRSVLSIELASARVDAQQRISLVALARAIGGGWADKEG